MHPLLRKQRSVWSSSPLGSYDCHPSLFYEHSVGSFNDEEMFDERVASSQSASPPDEGYSETDESGSGQFNMNPNRSKHAMLARRNTEPPQAPMRAPSAAAQQHGTEPHTRV